MYGTHRTYHTDVIYSYSTNFTTVLVIFCEAATPTSSAIFPEPPVLEGGVKKYSTQVQHSTVLYIQYSVQYKVYDMI